MLFDVYPAKIYLFKVNNRKTRKRCEICSKTPISISPENFRKPKVVKFLLNKITWRTDLTSTYQKWHIRLYKCQTIAWVILKKTLIVKYILKVTKNNITKIVRNFTYFKLILLQYRNQFIGFTVNQLTGHNMIRALPVTGITHTWSLPPSMKHILRQSGGLSN